ncbi:MAG: hypothetical protein AABY22_23000 [Nanoarchaeota archaeon]
MKSKSRKGGLDEIDKVIINLKEMLIKEFGQLKEDENMIIIKI